MEYTTRTKLSSTLRSMLARSNYLLLLATISTLANSQTRAARDISRLDKYGTCAVTAIAPSGEAFIIDSRVTNVDISGHVLSQIPGCKVLLARPTILLAGVGLEDTSGLVSHWNSLDKASDALKKLPDNPTVEEFDSWSMNWGQTLIDHYRRVGETLPPIGEVADVLLMTRVGDSFYYSRTIVSWDGVMFSKTILAQPPDQSTPAIHYAGRCRSFASVNDGVHQLPIAIQRTPAEDQRFRYWGKRKEFAKSVDDLAKAVYGIESVITDMDKRLDPDRAVIAPPYATAEWAKGDKGWTTDFNPECKSLQPK